MQIQIALLSSLFADVGGAIWKCKRICYCQHRERLLDYLMNFSQYVFNIDRENRIISEIKEREK